VDFSLNEQQEMMQTLARDFLSTEYSDKVLREMAASERGYTDELWQKMAAINLTGLAIPEEYGGVGDFLDLVVVLEEMGKFCLISPFFATLVLGAQVIMAAGSDEQKRKFLSEIAEGRLMMTLALTEPQARYTAETIAVTAVPQNGQFVINGTKIFVPDAHASHYMICVARTKEAARPEDGITLFMVDMNTPGVSVNLLDTIAGDKQCEVSYHNVMVTGESVIGEVDKGWPIVERVMARAAVGRCAEMVGVAQQALNITLDYAKERIAFGHPIGAFQSIQHRCADMLVDIDGSRFITYQAAWRLNEGIPADREVAMAKAWVGRACRRVVGSAQQIHGAIGFTEDHILHFYTKRASACEFSFGDADFHLEKLATQLV
jgi:alkylation response protein AidB-like acyl-CoA dehydrogenase